MMKNGEIRIIYVIISIFVALGLLLGGFYLYQKYMVENPLMEKLSAINEVQKVEIDKTDKVYTIHLHLARVDNIQESYANIESVANTRLKEGSYKIEIEDKRSPQLANLFNEIQPALYQGLAQKQYLWLDEQMQVFSRDKNIEARLFVDEKRLYLQMKDGDSYLYNINKLNAIEQEIGRGEG